MNEQINATLPKIAITDFHEEVLNFVKIHSINCQIQNKMKADSSQFDTKFANGMFLSNGLLLNRLMPGNTIDMI